MSARLILGSGHERFTISVYGKLTGLHLQCVEGSPAALVEVMECPCLSLPQDGTQAVLPVEHPSSGQIDDTHGRSAERDALKDLDVLKRHLKALPTDQFWPDVTKGISRILGSEAAFLLKPLYTEKTDSGLEPPQYDEHSSSLMAVAFHYSTECCVSHTIQDTAFSECGYPWTYTDSDKVILIPANFNASSTNDSKKLPIPPDADAYISIPILTNVNCVAHFGAMWSRAANARRRLSWEFVEMILHSLEDLILRRLLESPDVVQSSSNTEKQAIDPKDAASLARSLRPYAGSLSHELRTPMQGIVGMLDVMYATVQEAVEVDSDPKQRKMFQDLKESIEVIQDSSRRAVEAADNVVHAYDMDMSVPEAPSQSMFDELDSASPFSAPPIDRRPEIFVAGSNLPLSRKRRREDAFSRQSSNASSSQFQKIEGARSAWSSGPEPSQEMIEGVHQAEEVQSHAFLGATAADAPTAEDAELAANPMATANRTIVPGLRHANMRDVFQYVINEGLKMGGRPDSALAQETENGERIEVRSRGSDGTAGANIIDWSVDPMMPHTLFTDEKDLSKLISCVFLNAIKFADQNAGHVGIHARMSARGRCISIKISDNGPGIPAAFLPKLFKPFSRENYSTTRQSEGLGLGLMVAKGIARKLGGDLMCTRAETEGPNHGSEFEIKIPVMAGETISRPSSPFASPLPRKAALAPLEVPKTPPFPPLRQPLYSPTRLSQELHKMVSETRFKRDMPSTPPSPKSQPRLPVPEPAVTVTSTPPTPPNGAVSRPRIRKSVSNPEIDRDLAKKYPLTFLVAEDNNINRKLLISMLNKFGYKAIHEAHDGAEAVRQMQMLKAKIDVVLMDLWMPLMDGYEATERILKQDAYEDGNGAEKKPTVLAVTADVTGGAQERAASVGMKGFMTKPYKIHDLQRLITEYCAQRRADMELESGGLPLLVEG